jgi:hypothetical protein
MMRCCRFLIATAALALPAAAGAQQLGGGAAPDLSLVRVFLALLVCLVIAVLAVLFLRQRFSGKPPQFLERLRPSSARIRLVESRRISPQGELCIAEVDGEEFLLLLSPGGPLVLDRGRKNQST